MKIITRITKNDFAPFTSSETCIRYKNGDGDEFVGIVRSLYPEFKWGKAMTISIEYAWLVRVRNGFENEIKIPFKGSMVENRRIEFPNPQLIKNGKVLEFSSKKDMVVISVLEKDLVFAGEILKEYKLLSWENYEV